MQTDHSITNDPNKQPFPRKLKIFHWNQLISREN